MIFSVDISLCWSTLGYSLTTAFHNCITGLDLWSHNWMKKKDEPSVAFHWVALVIFCLLPLLVFLLVLLVAWKTKQGKGEKRQTEAHDVSTIENNEKFFITNQTFPGHSGKSGHLGKAYSHLRIDVDVDDMIQSFIAKNLQPYFSRSFGQFWPLDRLIYCCIKLVFHCKKNSIILSQVIRAILATWDKPFFIWCWCKW